MQKSVRSIALVLAILAVPAMSFAREPMGGNPRPQQLATTTVLNQAAIALGVITGR